MSDAPSQVLLPSGFADLVEDAAEKESWLIETILNRFRRSGYRRVKPTLIEFENSLMAPSGSCRDMFRMMDPRSGDMVALRCDATVQIARLARTTLARRARPLRLAYCADVVRVEGEPLHPQRQLCQIGTELIGADSFDADLEILRLGIDAVGALGGRELTLDLNMSRLATDLFDHYELAGEVRNSLALAIERKDAAALAASPTPAARDIEGLLAAAGPAREGFRALGSIRLPARPGERLEEFLDHAGRVAAALPEMMITLDPIEQRGFDYHTGMTFSYFSPDVRREIGRGGRYRAGVGASSEEAVGCSLFTDSLLRLRIEPPGCRRIFLPREAKPAVAEDLRAEGWIVIAGLEAKEGEGQARRLGCGYLYREGKIVALESSGSSASRPKPKKGR